MKGSTALVLVVGTAVCVGGALLYLHMTQPIVLRGVAVTKSLRNSRTVLTLRAKSDPETALASTSPDPAGCFEIPLSDVDEHESGELMLHAKRGRVRAVVSPVGPRAATEFVATLDRSGQRPQLLLGQADAATRERHSKCFR